MIQHYGTILSNVNKNNAKKTIASIKGMFYHPNTKHPELKTVIHLEWEMDHIRHLNAIRQITKEKNVGKQSLHRQRYFPKEWVAKHEIKEIQEKFWKVLEKMINISLLWKKWFGSNIQTVSDIDSNKKDRYPFFKNNDHYEVVRLLIPFQDPTMIAKSIHNDCIKIDKKINQQRFFVYYRQLHDWNNKNHRFLRNKLKN